MIQKIINNKGGLHNRVTKKILLQPFTLTETEAYFQSRNISFSRYQILLLYMTMGGIPHYLDRVKRGKSAIQNIDEICFHPQGLLRTEFDNLYSSLFLHPEKYETIVSALASTWKGLSRSELLTSTQLKDGGGFTKIHRELEQSGFISSYVPFNKKKKDKLFRLTDNYSLFYLKYIQHLPANEPGNWQAMSQLQSWKSWSGYAFENICLQHIDQIKAALGIASVYTRQLSFWAKTTANHEGAQIDLLIDRQDNIISICEMKFYNDDLTLTKEAAAQLRRKRRVFKQVSGAKKQLSFVIITSFGLIQNQHSLDLIDQVLSMNDLF